MFIDNKYTKIYFSLMNKAKNRDDESLLYEEHHITPKSLGGSNKVENIVKLTPREHFIAHSLLTKMCIDSKHKKAMSYAFVIMKISNSSSGYNRIGNGKLYEKIRNRVRKHFCGENNPFYGNSMFAGDKNPFYGKKHTKETRDNLSAKLKNKLVGDKNPFYGKKHTKEVRDTISKHQKESVTIIFNNGEIKTFDKKGDIGHYLGKSKALGIQLCSIKRHLWNKYNIKDILYENNINQKG